MKLTVHLSRRRFIPADRLLRRGAAILALAAWAATAAAAQSAPSNDTDVAPGDTRVSNGDQAAYILGAGDQVLIRLPEVEEINGKPIQIENDGSLRLPLIGRVQVSGLTLPQFEGELMGRLKTYLVHPDVSVSIVSFHSQPVSVFGAVKTPGVYQVEGRRTVFEVLSLAGGLDSAAGSTLKISRRIEFGRIPLPTAADDATARFSVATIKLKSILSAENPEENIAIKPHDVITVPRAEVVYVIGEVHKPGGFPLMDQESMTVLQALSLAGGLDRTAAPKSARVLRVASGANQRTELNVNVKAILEGSASDLPMKSEDILFIPSSQTKRAAARAAEAAVQIVTGVVIWRR